MIELEENIKKIQILKSKLESIGESLWHSWNGKRTKRIGRKNSWN